jgi:hypothetical protein
VAGRIAEDPEALAAGIQAERAQFQCPRLTHVQVLDEEVEVACCGCAGSGQRGG